MDWHVHDGYSEVGEAGELKILDLKITKTDIRKVKSASSSGELRHDVANSNNSLSKQIQRHLMILRVLGLSLKKFL